MLAGNAAGYWILMTFNAVRRFLRVGVAEHELTGAQRNPR